MPKIKERSKKKIIARMNEVGYTTRFCNSICPTAQRRSAGEIDEEKREVPFVMISANNAGERYDWWSGETYIEELDVNGANTEMLRTLFKDHHIVVDNAIGRVEDVEVKDETLQCKVVFGTDDDSAKIFRKYVDGTLNDVSIGYIVRDIVVTEKEDEPTHILVTKFDVVELSAVGIGFDKEAGRSQNKTKGAKDKRDKKRVKKPKKTQKKVKKHKEEVGVDVQLLQKKLDLKGK